MANGKERPILFSGPMVRAILDGKKTQTRRLVGLDTLRRADTPGYDWTWRGQAPVRSIAQQRRHPGGCWQDVSNDRLRSLCPYGVPGDRLWVRETWVELLAVSPASDEPMEIGPGERLVEPPTSWVDSNGRTRWHYDGRVIAYRANSQVEFCDGDGFMGDTANRDDMPRWRPSIYMPRWASRITLEIKSVRVEQLQDISEEDAKAEGCHAPSPRAHFAGLWDSINHDRAPWASNPWVWRVEFARVEAANGKR